MKRECHTCKNYDPMCEEPNNQAGWCPVDGIPALVLADNYCPKWKAKEKP